MLTLHALPKHYQNNLWVFLFFILREEVESDLTLLGLLIMENRLKAETKPVLEELSAARIRSVMITGIFSGSDPVALQVQNSHIGQ